MPSPFPGMNPYIEGPRTWHNFHNAYLVEMQKALVPQVRPEYVVKAQVSLFVEAGADESDVLIFRPFAGPRHGPNGHSAVALLEPPARARLPEPRPRLKHRWLELRDRADMRLVTAIELLSPANKRPGRDRRLYERKRLRLIDAGVNFIEIDLLRAGPRLPLEGLPPCDYYALVSRPDEWPDAGVWPLALRDPLPTIPVPLRPPEPDARLDLQAMLHRVYDDAGFTDYAYRAPPDPPLSDADQAWADALRADALRADVPNPV